MNDHDNVGVEQGQLRFTLERRLSYLETARILWVMLNPSTATVTHNDRTIRRCIGFSKRWGYGQMTVVNLSPLRATKPKHLRPISDTDFVFNLVRIGAAIQNAHGVILAYGGNVGQIPRGDLAVQYLRWRQSDVQYLCLGRNADNPPKHPLYVRKNTHPFLYHFPPTTIQDERAKDWELTQLVLADG